MSSAARTRTRRAILDAAVRTLSRNFSAPLAEIAAEAGVGRTTMHRYFPERGVLLEAISADALERADAASERARLDDGLALDALERLCEELFDLGDVLMLLFNEPQLMSGPAWEEAESDRTLLELIARGQAEGSIDAALPPAWAQTVLWSLLYAAFEHARSHGASKHEALGLCRRTLRRAIAAQR